MSFRTQFFVILAGVAIVAAGPSWLFAQNPNPGNPRGVRQTAPGRKPSGERFQGKGTIDAIRADEISMTTTDGQSLKLKISKKGKVHVIGSLTPEDLQKGKNVLFNAVIDKKTRRVKEPIKKLTIFTPSKDQPAGLFPDTAATTGAGDETIDLSAHWTMGFRWT
jgi:hypothetical protein